MLLSILFSVNFFSILIVGSGHSFLWYIRHWEWIFSICVSFFCSSTYLEIAFQVIMTSCLFFPNWHLIYTFHGFFSSENAGLLALTRVGSRRVVQISASFMIFFSILGKWFILWLISLVLFLLMRVLNKTWVFRKIWSRLCLDSSIHCCSNVLLLLRLCWYVMSTDEYFYVLINLIRKPIDTWLAPYIIVHVCRFRRS